MWTERFQEQDQRDTKFAENGSIRITVLVSCPLRV